MKGTLPPANPARTGETSPAAAVSPAVVERADEPPAAKAKAGVKVRSANVTHNVTRDVTHNVNHGGAAPSRAALPAASATTPEPSRHAKESSGPADSGDSIASTKNAPTRPAMRDENPYPVAPQPPPSRPRMKDENPYPASTPTAPNMKNESPYGL